MACGALAFELPSKRMNSNPLYTFSYLFAESELHVDVHDGNVLRFGHNPMAEREKEDEEEEGVFHRAERVSSFRNRNLRMPDNAVMDGPITATYHDGVLEIIVPKKKAPVQTEPKKISVA